MQGEALIDQPATGEPVAPTGADRAREALRARRTADALDRWDTTDLPGGFVCSVCATPVESEPCRDHQPVAWAKAQGPSGTRRGPNGLGVTHAELADFIRRNDADPDPPAGTPIELAGADPASGAPLTNVFDLDVVKTSDGTIETTPEFLARGGRLIGGERITGVQASTEPGGELRFVPVVDASSVVPDEEDSPSNCRSCGEALDDGQSFLCGACALAGSWTPDQDRPAHGTGWQDPATVAAASDLVRATLNGIGLGDHECEPAPDQVYFCRHCGADLDPEAINDGDHTGELIDVEPLDGLSVAYVDSGYPTPPWRTPLGPDEPIRISLPGVYDLTAEEYHDVNVTGDWLSNSDVKKILQTCPAQFQYDRWNGVRKTSDAFDFGHVWHARVLGKGEAYRVFEPKKLDGRTKEGKAQRAEVDAARAAGITPIYGDQFALIEAMAQAVEVDPVALGLMSAPGRQEVCLFWTETIKVTNPQNSLYGQMVTVKRRAMIDHLPDMPDDPNATVVLVDGKTADEVKPDDNMRKKIYDYGYHRQADTYAAGVEALFNRAAEVVFLFQSKKPPHLIVPVDLDTPAMLVAAAENRQVMEVWAECVATGVWSGYTKGIATSGVPAWIERQFEDEMVIG